MPSAIRVVDRFRDLADVNFTPGAGVDGYAMVYDHATGKLVPSASVPNAGTLDGLDSTAFALAGHTHPLSALTQSGATTGQAAVWDGAAWAPGSAGVTDHGALTGLADDDHSAIYVSLAPAASARNLIQTAADVTLLRIKQAAGQANNATNLLAVELSAGTVTAGIHQSGYFWSGNYYFTNPYNDVARLSYGSSTITVTAARLAIGSGLGASAVPFTVNLAAAQTANAINVTSSGGAAGDVFKVTSAGDIVGAKRLYLAQGLGVGGASPATTTCVVVPTSGSYYIADASNGLSYIGSNSWGLYASATLRIQLNATGIGFFAATPVAKATALTAADAGALNTGDAGSDTVIGNIRTRLGELETKLQAYGLLT